MEHGNVTPSGTLPVTWTTRFSLQFSHSIPSWNTTNLEVTEWPSFSYLTNTLNEPFMFLLLTFTPTECALDTTKCLLTSIGAKLAKFAAPMSLVKTGVKVSYITKLYQTVSLIE